MQLLVYPSILLEPYMSNDVVLTQIDTDTIFSIYSEMISIDYS